MLRESAWDRFFEVGGPLWWVEATICYTPPPPYSLSPEYEINPETICAHPPMSFNPRNRLLPIPVFRLQPELVPPGPSPICMYRLGGSSVRLWRSWYPTAVHHPRNVPPPPPPNTKRVVNVVPVHFAGRRFQTPFSFWAYKSGSHIKRKGRFCLCFGFVSVSEQCCACSVDW